MPEGTTTITTTTTTTTTTIFQHFHYIVGIYVILFAYLFCTLIESLDGSYPS